MLKEDRNYNFVGDLTLSRSSLLDESEMLYLKNGLFKIIDYPNLL